METIKIDVVFPSDVKIDGIPTVIELPDDSVEKYAYFNSYGIIKIEMYLRFFKYTCHNKMEFSISLVKDKIFEKVLNEEYEMIVTSMVETASKDLIKYMEGR